MFVVPQQRLSPTTAHHDTLALTTTQTINNTNCSSVTTTKITKSCLEISIIPFHNIWNNLLSRMKIGSMMDELKGGRSDGVNNGGKGQLQLTSFKSMIVMIVLMILLVIVNDNNGIVFGLQYSIGRFHSQLTLANDRQCVVDVSETVTYLFDGSTSLISRRIPTTLPYGFARIVGEITVTPSSTVFPGVKVASVNYVKSNGDNMRQIDVLLKAPTSSVQITDITLQYSYKIKGPLYVFQNQTRASWAVGFEDAQAINDIEITFNFPTNMLTNLTSAQAVSWKVDGPQKIGTFPTSSVKTTRGSYTTYFTGVNVMFDSCQTMWYHPETSVTIIAFYLIPFMVMAIVLGIKAVRDNIASYKEEQQLERERYSRYARQKHLHHEDDESDDDIRENHSFLSRGTKAYDNL